MMKIKAKIMLFTVIAAFGVSGIVSAAGVWGTYKGNDIVRLTVNGTPVKVTDVPAINYQSRTMVPIYLLQQAGVGYTWDNKSKTVNVTKSEAAGGGTRQAEQEAIDAALRVAQLTDRIAYVEAEKPGKITRGSGFIIEPGILISASHVISGASKVTVAADDANYDASEWMYFDNPTLDIFAAPVSSSYNTSGEPNGTGPTKFLKYTTTLPENGDRVFAIGNPRGEKGVVTAGRVTGILRFDGITYIQHSANTEPGNSGGALLNEKGEVIGVTVSGVEGTTEEYALPMSYVQTELDKS